MATTELMQQAPREKSRHVGECISACGGIGGGVGLSPPDAANPDETRYTGSRIHRRVLTVASGGIDSGRYTILAETGPTKALPPA